jgi:hypothetical protein
MPNKPPQKRHEFDDGPSVTVHIENTTWQTLTPSKFVWHYGGLLNGGWPDRREFELLPELADYPRISQLSNSEEILLTQIRATSQIRGIFGAKSEWDGELVYSDPLDPSRETTIWTTWQDHGVAINAMLSVKGPGKMETLLVIPGSRLSRTPADVLQRHLLNGAGRGRECALPIVMAEKESPANRSLVFTLPMQQGDSKSPELIYELQLATTADRDSLRKP